MARKGEGLSRRDLAGVALAGVAAVYATPGWAKAKALAPRLLPAQRAWMPVPVQAPVTEGVADLGDTKLYYWDTGGRGEPVILLHALTGSAMNWGYQQPVFAAAGYRVIAYSRRGHAKSEPILETALGTEPDDLDRLADFLKVDRFHAVGQSSGGSILTDYAMSRGDRLLSMTMACGSGRLSEPSFQAMLERLAAPGMLSLPPSARELGPSYRAANPEGVKQWEALERASRGGKRIPQPPRKNRTNFADIETIRTPALSICGTSDLVAPPTVMMTVASHLQRSEVVILSEAGHAAYWEQPLNYNRTILEFMRKHRA